MTDKLPTQTAPNMDKTLAWLREQHGDCPALHRIAVVEQASSDLFDASLLVWEWLKTIRVEDRPIAYFNRLEDALNGVREAHIMEPVDVRR
jgi:hypothetical protein